jgi:hypothetical protein
MNAQLKPAPTPQEEHVLDILERHTPGMTTGEIYESRPEVFGEDKRDGRQRVSAVLCRLRMANKVSAVLDRETGKNTWYLAGQASEEPGPRNPADESVDVGGAAAESVDQSGPAVQPCRWRTADGMEFDDLAAAECWAGHLEEVEPFLSGRPGLLYGIDPVLAREVLVRFLVWRALRKA